MRDGKAEPVVRPGLVEPGAALQHRSVQVFGNTRTVVTYLNPA